MAAESAMIVVTGAAAALLAATFLLGGRVHPFRTLVRDRRSIISFSAGISTAYVFVHVMPELSEARHALVASATGPLRYEGMAIYGIALVGFLTFYGLDHLAKRLRGGSASQAEAAGIGLHVGGFGAYVLVMAYLLVNGLGDSTVSKLLFALAIAVHFLTIDHSLRAEYGAAYENTGRFVLAGLCVAGWALGLVVALPHATLALLVAFISGAIIINSTIMELPSEKDGRFLPFLAGGVLYGLILMPLSAS